MNAPTRIAVMLIGVPLAGVVLGAIAWKIDQRHSHATAPSTISSLSSAEAAAIASRLQGEIVRIQGHPSFASDPTFRVRSAEDAYFNRSASWDYRTVYLDSPSITCHFDRPARSDFDGAESTSVTIEGIADFAGGILHLRHCRRVY